MTAQMGSTLDVPWGAQIAPLDSAPFGAKSPSLLWQLLVGRRDFGTAAGPGQARRATKLRSRLRRFRPVFDVICREMKLRLYPAENDIDRKLVVFGTHAAFEELQPAQEALATAQVFVDIGANVGLYTLTARSMMPADARLICFEPHPRTVRKLRQNVSFSGAENVDIVHAAVGATRTELTLYAAASGNAGRNTLVEAYVTEADAARDKVAVRPLLDMLAALEVDRIDVLKIDVEGYEATALAPFFDTAPQSMWPGYIIMEVAGRSEWESDLVARLLGDGYETVLETPSDMHLRRPARLSDDTSSF